MTVMTKNNRLLPENRELLVVATPRVLKRTKGHLAGLNSRSSAFLQNHTRQLSFLKERIILGRWEQSTKGLHGPMTKSPSSDQMGLPALRDPGERTQVPPASDVREENFLYKHSNCWICGDWVEAGADKGIHHETKTATLGACERNDWLVNCMIRIDL